MTLGVIFTGWGPGDRRVQSALDVTRDVLGDSKYLPKPQKPEALLKLIAENSSMGPLEGGLREIRDQVVAHLKATNQGVVVVDDAEDVRGVITALLNTDQGENVAEYENYDAAAEVLEMGEDRELIVTIGGGRRKISVMILDGSLPGMSLQDFLRGL